MFGVTKLTGLVRCLSAISAGTSTDDKMTYKFMKSVTDGSGRPSPLTFEGQYLEELPECFQALTVGLKNPKVTFKSKSMRKGQGILGVAVFDGNKATSRFALNIDETAGQFPVIQIKARYGTGQGQVLGLDVLQNPNVVLDPNKMNIGQTIRSGGAEQITRYMDENKKSAFVFGTSYDKKLAKTSILPSDCIKGLRKGHKSSAKVIDGLNENWRSLWKTKGVRVRSVNDCMGDIVKVAQRSGKPTLKSVEEAKDTIVKSMGLNPEDVKVLLDDSPAECLTFDQATGAISVSKGFLDVATNQDVAFTLAHELTHMEDFLKLYRNMDPKDFEKLVGFGVEDFKVDHKWYKKVSKNVDPEWKKCAGLVKTEIVKDGNVELVVNHQAFNSKSMITDHNVRTRLLREDFQGPYGEMKECNFYQFSLLEQHARVTESNVAAALKDAGIFQETKFSAKMGEGPFSGLGRYRSRFTPIDEALGKLGGNRADKFNELYYKNLAQRDERLAELCKKWQSTHSMPSEEYDEMQKLITDNFSNERTFQSRMLDYIAEDLNVTLPDY